MPATGADHGVYVRDRSTPAASPRARRLAFGIWRHVPYRYGRDPTQLAIPPEGLAVGLIAAVGAACMSIIPTGILPIYGPSIVTGTAMFISGIVSSIFIQPWNKVPALDGVGWGALLVLIFVGSCLAYALYLQGVKDIGSVRASLLGTVEPVSATVTSALFLGTFFAPTDIIGFALIIFMVFLTA